jgi:hypothetical protein
VYLVELGLGKTGQDFVPSQDRPLQMFAWLVKTVGLMLRFWIEFLVQLELGSTLAIRYDQAKQFLVGLEMVAFDDVVWWCFDQCQWTHHCHFLCVS